MGLPKTEHCCTVRGGVGRPTLLCRALFLAAFVLERVFLRVQRVKTLASGIHGLVAVGEGLSPSRRGIWPQCGWVTAALRWPRRPGITRLLVAKGYRTPPSGTDSANEQSHSWVGDSEPVVCQLGCLLCLCWCSRPTRDERLAQAGGALQRLG